MTGQFPFQRIHVHVVKLFDSLLQPLHVEIMEATLPETRQRVLGVRKIQLELCGWLPLFASQAARDALFQDLNHDGGRTFGRLGNEKMNVLGHDHIAKDTEDIASAHSFESALEEFRDLSAGRIRKPVVTTEGEEMKVFTLLEPFEPGRHGGGILLPP